MARLAAVLWSLCITAVLVTSATQGRCCWGKGGVLPLEGSGEGRKKPLVKNHSPLPTLGSGETRPGNIGDYTPGGSPDQPLTPTPRA